MTSGLRTSSYIIHLTPIFLARVFCNMTRSKSSESFSVLESSTFASNPRLQGRGYFRYLYKICTKYYSKTQSEKVMRR